MANTTVVFGCDSNYFSLAKGLVLSIGEAPKSAHGFKLAFIDIGCTPEQREWLCSRQIQVVPFDSQILGELAQQTHGYQQALVLRPFLPSLFPEANAIIWLDCDLWIQSPDVLPMFSTLALAHPDKLFVCPEWHYSYLDLNSRFIEYQINNLAFYYKALFGDEIAASMAGRPLLNMGVFAMGTESPLWDLWKQSIRVLYSRRYGANDHLIRHMAEQLAMNVIVTQRACAVPVDPLFNYMCMWGTPFRDPAGIVRVGLPPNQIINVVHLSLWKQRHNFYLEQGLLYQAGSYLSEAERVILSTLTHG